MSEVTNSQFLNLAYGDLVDDYGWTTSFRADPGSGPPELWMGQPWTGSDSQRVRIDGRPEDNNFFCVAVMSGGEAKRHKSQFTRLAVLLADDVDPKELLGSAPYILQTSPGRYQAGVVLDSADPDVRNVDLVEAVVREMSGRGLISADRSGNSIVRYGRLPVGSNTKARNGEPFRTHLIAQPDGAYYSLSDAAATFGVDLETLRTQEPQVSPERLESRQKPAELYRALLKPDPAQRSYHDPLLRISAQWRASGMNEAAAIDHLRALGEVIRPANDNREELERHAARFGLDLDRMVRGAGRFSPETTLPSKLIYTVRELMETIQDQEWIVDDLVPESSMGMIFGASGTFKSFLAIDLAMHVIGNRPWAGLETSGGPVLYVAAEGAGVLHRRVQAWCKVHGIALPDDLFICHDQLNLSDDDQVDRLAEAITALSNSPRLIVIDTMAQSFDGDENSSRDISAFLRTLKRKIQAPFGATVIVIHHTGHADRSRPRGSSALEANLDFMMFASRPEGSLSARLAVQKQRDGEIAAPLEFELQKVDLGRSRKGKAITSLVARPAPDRNTIALALNLDDWRQVQKVISEGDWRQDHQTGKAWAGLAIAEALGIDPGAKGRLQELLTMGFKEGYLGIERRPARRHGRDCPFVVIGSA
jgi:hypothetical protein